jgi:hypothetical protein
MRGDSTQQAVILSAITPDQLVAGDHPIRRIKPIVERVLGALSPVFRTMYARTGRRSIPPEHLLKASLLIACSRCAASGSSASGCSTTCCSSGSWT